MIFVKTFLLNLLCSVVACDPDFGLPEIVEADRLNQGTKSRTLTITNSLTIVTKSGPVKGYFMKSASGRKIRAFEGIPYAEPPINQFRFRSANRKKPWESVLQAKGIGPYCLQLHATKLFRVVGQEDCLFLNVYAPNIMETGTGLKSNSASENGTKGLNDLLPVIIWIHGGAFIFGSGGEYGPAYMADEDVILVTLNYRLGVLGFLTTGDENSPGNLGLKDQALAIEWIHENIEEFGGDPNRVMLLGQSAGAASVHLHMLSKYPTRKYFQSAVSLSGNAFVHWALRSPKEGRRLAAKTAEQLGCPSGNGAEIMSCLRELSPVTLVANQINLFEWLPFPVVLFGPVIETESSDAFIVDTADALYDRKEVSEIPWITSSTAQEGHTALLFTETLSRTDAIRSHWEDLAPLVLDYKDKVNDSEALSRKISQFYFGDSGPASSTLDKLSEIASDRYFTFGFHKALQRHSRIAPTYGHIFSYKGNYGLGNALGYNSSEWGVGHAEDVFYIFNSSSIYPGFKERDPERDLSKILIKFLTNFARDGVPYYTGKDGEHVHVWNKIDNLTRLQVLQIDREIKMIPEPFVKRLRFWQNLNLDDMKPFVLI